tara:strand:- start:388 stop:969 length:582 start_codon:yes stop_codon:yes gene_type:complete
MFDKIKKKAKEGKAKLEEKIDEVKETDFSSIKEKANEAKKSIEWSGKVASKAATKVGSKAIKTGGATISAGFKVAKVAKSAGGKIMSTGAKTSKSVIDSVVIKVATRAVVKSLKKAVETGSENITDDAKYTKIIEKTWEAFPLPVRLVGKDTLNYKDIMFKIRNTVFDSSTNDLEIDKEDENFITKSIKDMFR